MRIAEQGNTQLVVKLSQDGEQQILALPEGFQFDSAEVFLRRSGDEVILSARPRTWAEYLDHGAVASPEFMENVEELPQQEREFF